MIQESFAARLPEGLVRELNYLDQVRKFSRFRTSLVLFFIFVVFSVPVLGSIYFRHNELAIVLASVFFGAGLGVLFWYYYLRHCLTAGELSLRYKQIIMPVLMARVDPTWKMSHSHRLVLKDVVESGLYKEELNSMLRDDYLFGPAGNADAEIFQVYFRVSGTRYAGGRYSASRVTTYTDHFSGLFFRIHKRERFPCKVWILPAKRKSKEEVDDWAEITRKAYEKRNGVYLVRTGNIDFDTRFVIFCDSADKAPKTLTPEKMELLSRFADRFPFDCAFSFVNNHIFAMAGFNYDLFDVTFSTPLNEKKVDEHYSDLVRIRETAELLTR